MSDRFNIIRGILQWFCFEPQGFKSYQTVERTCRRAVTANLGERNTRYAAYDFFYPLLRWGLVEYYGNDRYRLSPPAAIFHQSKTIVYHAPAAMDYTLQSFKLTPFFPGISLYTNCSEVVAACKTYNIPLMRFEIYRLISLIPTIEKLIHLWQEEQVIDASSYLHFNECSSWVSIKDNVISPGVYKKADTRFAGRIIKLATGEWRVIPQRKQQFDGFPLAVLLGRILNGHELGIRYLKQRSLLDIQTHFFPIVLERLLFISALFSDYSHLDVADRKYRLDSKAFTIINRIFHNTIQIT